MPSLEAAAGLAGWLRARHLGVGPALVAALVLVAAAAPWLAPYDPIEQLDPRSGALRPPGTELAAIHLRDGDWQLAEHVQRLPQGLAVERLGQRGVIPAARVLNLTANGVAGRRRFVLGSDQFGRDVASRLLYAARFSLAIGVLSVLLALTLGVALGALAALGGRFWDALTMRLVDALLAFPWLFLMIALSALLRPSTAAMVVLLGGTSWMSISRLTRAELRGLAGRDFVLAARALGEHPLAVLLRHMLPNAMTPLLVRSTQLVGRIILLESGLSFLGLGLQPPTPSLGNMIADAYHGPPDAWWLAVFPGAVLALIAVSFSFLGDDLRDLLDPRLRRSPGRRAGQVVG